jgi:hypothetical protein
MDIKKALQIRFPANLGENLQKRAKKARRSLNAEVLICLEEYFEFANLMDGISDKLLAKIEDLASEETNGNLSDMMAILLQEAVDERDEGFIQSKLDGVVGLEK